MTNMETLEQVLRLVGPLDDSSGANTARDRFRDYLTESVGSVGIVRDYIEACLRNKGPQYDRALQDLVNHAATLLGFEVEFGRYQGVVNDIGFDGLWKRNDFFIVAEVKTTDAFSIQTRQVIGYVDELISARRIPNWEQALGLYIFGRSDSGLMQLANTINAEKRGNQLRIATIDSILSLTELVQAQQISADEAISLLRPENVFVAETVQLLSRIAAMVETESIEAPTSQSSIGAIVESKGDERRNENQDQGRIYLLTPVSHQGDESGEEIIRGLLESGWYVMKDGSTGLRKLRPGDRICFYLSTVGVVADAEVTSQPEPKPVPPNVPVRDRDTYRWRFSVSNPRFYFENPIVVDANLRKSLNAFAGKNPENLWSWFVQGSRYLTRHDFQLLTSSQRQSQDLNT